MRTHLKRKEVDDVLGGKDSWANVDVVDGESMSMPALAGPHSLNRILRWRGMKLEQEKEEERGREEEEEKEKEGGT